MPTPIRFGSNVGGRFLFWLKWKSRLLFDSSTPCNAVFMRWRYAKPKKVGVALVIWLPEIRTLASKGALNSCLSRVFAAARATGICDGQKARRHALSRAVAWTGKQCAP